MVPSSQNEDVIDGLDERGNDGDGDDDGEADADGDDDADGAVEVWQRPKPPHHYKSSPTGPLTPLWGEGE